MAKLEKSLRLELEYSSTLTDIAKEEDFLYLKKFLYQGNDVFRVGLKMSWKESARESLNPAIIFFLTSPNLQKMGQKVKAVISSVNLTNGIGDRAWRETKMKEVNMTTSGAENANEEKESIQLFTHLLKRSDIKCTDFTFYVTVHFTGIVDGYQVQQIDGLLSDQLWLSVTDQLIDADFKLIASDGNYLPAHKWMLAARSPVFAALLSSKEDITSLHLAVDCTVKEMKRFIRFIYTGELEGLVTQNLLQLAIKYQIKTLEQVCEAALKDPLFSLDQTAVIALHLKSGSYLCKIEEQ